eukprot:5243710-Pyramimonas_sp.AAC.1
MAGSSFTPTISLSSARTGCPCPLQSSSRALVGVPEQLMVVSNIAPNWYIEAAQGSAATATATPSRKHWSWRRCW